MHRTTFRDFLYTRNALLYTFGRAQVKRGVVPPCPPCYARKIYGSGPRFMSQDEVSDSEPELVVQARGHWEKNLGVRERMRAVSRGAAGGLLCWTQGLLLSVGVVENWLVALTFCKC